MRIVYMPGGIGAVAYNNIVARTRARPAPSLPFRWFAAQSGARQVRQKYSVDDVRWLAGIGADYGVAVVRKRFAYTDLKGLMEAFAGIPPRSCWAPAAPWAARTG